MKALIEKTQFAISTEETRYYLNGIYLHAVEADGKLKLRAVATDGHRLARAEVGGHRPARKACRASSSRARTVERDPETRRRSRRGRWPWNCRTPRSG